jgi:hypothetical protein
LISGLSPSWNPRIDQKGPIASATSDGAAQSPSFSR